MSARRRSSIPLVLTLFLGVVAGAYSGSPAIAAGTTSDTPIFRGRQSAIAEFEMVRLDAAGRMHIGMSAYRTQGATTQWAAYYQR